MTNRTVKNACDEIVTSENYTYDAAGNITDAPNDCFQYDTNNRLVVFDGSTVSYDMDGNMLSGGCISCEYDSGNRLIKAGSHSYTYNAEDVRIRNLCSDADTVYTYNTNAKLSQLLQKTTNGIATKYVYGLGLIGEEKNGEFKTYHFDFRGSTVAITDSCGNITDTFKYDTYGRLESRTGNSFVIFGYNGRDGVVTDRNGLLYMRARYYSPDMHRFINADIIPGEISNAVTLNRYAYANGNPVSNTDPFGLSAERGDTTINPAGIPVTSIPYDILQQILSVHNRKSTNFFYSDDYKNHVKVKVDQNGNITYVFFSYNDGVISDSYIATQYYFEVNKAGYWQSKLDYEKKNLFDNEIIRKFLAGLGEVNPPGSDWPTSVDFAFNIVDLISEFGPDFIGDTIKHNTELSSYLFDKVILKNPDENVAILKYVKTYKGNKWFWEDSLDIKKTNERYFY